MTLSLRVVAVAIAIAAAIDPMWTISGTTRPPVAVVVEDSQSMDLPGTDGAARRATAARVRAQLADALRPSYDIRSVLSADVRGAVVVSDRYASLSDHTIPIATVDVGTEAIAPNVRLLRVEAPDRVPPATTIRIEIDCEGVGVAGQTSVAAVLAGPLALATVDHTWTRAHERWHAVLEVPQAGPPPFAFRVRVQPLATERTDVDNAADINVDVRSDPFRVLVYEPRPSWATTFVRRALESDSRFAVAGLTRTSRGIATRTGETAQLTDVSLAQAEAIVVGGLDGVTQNDARLLDRFMRERGGAVVVAPDSRIDARPVREWLQIGAVRERLTERPETLAVRPPLAPVRASELLSIDDLPPLADRMAWTTGTNAAVVAFSAPRGTGRLVFVGALDAWRYRADSERTFESFWQGVVAGAALAAARPVEIALMPAVARPKQLVEVEARVQSQAVSASVDGIPIRLWPAGEENVFRGSFTAPAADGRFRVVVRREGAGQGEDSRTFLVRRDAARVIPSVRAPLGWLSATHGGVTTTPATIGGAIAFIRGAVPPAAARVPLRPFRSAWWFIPFAGCLSAEWYLRRRRGQR